MKLYPVMFVAGLVISATPSIWIDLRPDDEGV